MRLMPAVSMTTTHFTIDFRSRLLPRFPRPPSARDHITPPKQLSLMFSQLISLAYRCAGFPPVTQGRSSSYLPSWPSKLRQNIASSLVTPPTPKIHHKERVAPPSVSLAAGKGYREMQKTESTGRLSVPIPCMPKTGGPIPQTVWKLFWPSLN